MKTSGYPETSIIIFQSTQRNVLDLGNTAVMDGPEIESRCRQEIPLFSKMPRPALEPTQLHSFVTQTLYVD
jgi:hypothetical protein